MKPSIIIVIFNIIVFNLSAQENEPIDTIGQKPKLAIKSYTSPTDVQLRWAISDALLWLEVQKKQTTIYRAEIEDNGNIGDQKQIATIQAASMADLATKYNNDTEVAKIIKSFNSYNIVQYKNEDDFFNNLRKDHASYKNHHFGCMLAADINLKYAEALGLYYKDKDIKPGKKYLYTVEVIGKDSIKYSAQTATILSKESNEFLLPIEATCFEKSMAIKINTAINPHEWINYDIERSVNKQNNWQKLNNLPLINVYTSIKGQKDVLTFTDTTAVYGTIYDYRARGRNIFGILSDWSDNITIQLCDRMPPMPIENIVTTQLKPKINRISWDSPSDIKDVRGLFVSKCFTSDGQYTLVKHYTEHPFPTSIIDTLSAFKECYYKVQVYDSIGNVSYCFPKYQLRIDSMPPDVPQGLVGEIDTTGRVTLRWQFNYNDDDILGYRVYKANQDNHVFTNITGYLVQDTVYYDTINLHTLTENIYYKVVAVDNNYNHSAYCDKITLKKPDKVPPTAPLLIKIKPGIGTVSLEWVQSNSSDVVSQRIYRKAGAEEWKLFKELPKEETKLLDTNLDESIFYSYHIVAIDDAKLSSETSNTMSQRPLYDQIIKEKVILSINSNKENNEINVTWNTDGLKNNGYILQLYKVDKIGKLKLVYQDKNYIALFKDKASPDEMKGYCYQLIGKKGRTSAMSEVFSIN